MSELKANVRTFKGAVISTDGFPQGQIAKGTTEEAVIAYAMSGGWKLVQVSGSKEHRVLEFFHSGAPENYVQAEVLIANYENGALTNLWSTEDKYLNRTRFIGENRPDAPNYAPVFLANNGWKMLTALEGRAYYVRVPKKAVNLHPDQIWSEMYV